jgi:hypothetical protein
MLSRTPRGLSHIGAHWPVLAVHAQPAGQPWLFMQPQRPVVVMQRRFGPQLVVLAVHEHVPPVHAPPPLQSEGPVHCKHSPLED